MVIKGCLTKKKQYLLEVLTNLIISFKKFLVLPNEPLFVTPVFRFQETIDKVEREKIEKRPNFCTEMSPFPR